MTNQELIRLRNLLETGQRLTGQHSYKRRTPDNDALPYLTEAKDGFLKIIHEQPHLAEAWHLLSYAEECLLNFPAARQSLEQFLTLGGQKDKKTLKRLALLRKCEADWMEIPLSPSQLQNLGDHLDLSLGNCGCDHTYKLTEGWLKSEGFPNSALILGSLAENGGHCDCEVLANVVDG